MSVSPADCSLFGVMNMMADWWVGFEFQPYKSPFLSFVIYLVELDEFSNSNQGELKYTQK